MNTFAELTRGNTNEARTANGALSNAITLNAVLDFFSKSGALRGHDVEEITGYFSKAFSENESLAMKSLFYARDIRGGQGERKIFTDILSYLAETNEDAIRRNIRLIPEFGRWDDLFVLLGTPLQEDALSLIKSQLILDVEAEAPSVLAKWLKSANTSSKESKRIARITYKSLGMSEKAYRKTLSSLRQKIDVVERKMSGENWKSIDYSGVPSQATRIYSKAFRKHDEERYNGFIDKVANGEETINAGTLYPYQIVKGILKLNYTERKAVDVMWNALPNYMEKQENALCVVDTSGSMYYGYTNVAPIDVSVSLGIYFAERNIGAFKDYFMTFSSNPVMQKIQGKNIYEKYSNLRSAEWGMGTNLQKVFMLLLQTAFENHVPQDEMPKKIYIISDMQFNQACYSRDDRNIDAIKKLYEEAGYEIPGIVFWNVNASSDTPVTKDEHGTFLVSGCSPSILKYAINCEALTPEKLMLEVLESERYKLIK